MHARPNNTLLTLPPGAYHRNRFGRGTLGSTSLTTIASHIVANALQAWPTAAAQIDVASAAGAADEDRQVQLYGVLADGDYTRVSKIVTLNASGQATIAASEGWLDVVRMRERTAGEDNPSAAVITASAGGTALCEIPADSGSSRTTREYVPGGQVAYIQRVNGDYDARINELAIWAQEGAGPWHTENDMLAGGGSNAGRDLGREYATITSWGVRVSGPARIEARGQANSGTVGITLEYTILFVPESQVQPSGDGEHLGG